MKRVAIALVLLLVVAIAPLSGESFAVASPSENQYVLKAVNVTASADAYSVYKYGKYYWNSSSSYHGKYELAIGNSPHFQKERAYLRFNLPEIPKAAEIASAEVCVYVAYIKYLYKPMNVGIYNITNEWNEDYTKPAPEPGILLDNTTLSKSWVCFNVTDYVKSRFPEQSLFSFVLKLVDENINNYAWIYSRENAFDKPILKVSYYVPIAIKSISVSSPTYTNSPIHVTSTITNKGTSDVNVTYVLLIDNKTVENKTITIPASGKVEETYTWVTSKEGTHIIKAVILGDGFSDSAIKVVSVQYNPYLLLSTLSRVYANAFGREYPIAKTLYENFTSTLEELQKCGVDLGDLKEDVGVINEEYVEMEKEYKKFNEMKRILLYQSSYYPIALHIRKAYTLGRDVEKRIERILPILQTTLEQVLPKCTKENNQTNTTNITIRIPKVLIDLSHGQYYLQNYGYQGLKENIENELGWKVEINLKPLTYEGLKDYDVLILTNPKKDLTDEEVKAIREFVQNGGGLIVAGDWYKYVNSKSLNALLTGTGVTFEKTELMDDVENSGRSYYPFVGVYNRNCSITKFIPDNWKMYFNGDTLRVTGNATWVIRGFDTAYAVSPDGSVVHDKGSEPVVAAAVVLGKGRIVVYGSSRAFSDAYHSRYIRSNWPFIKGALLWLVGQS